MNNRSQFGKRRSPHLSGTRADWHIDVQSENIVWIIDEDIGNMSVTNDAEAVVKAVFRVVGDKRIMYRDSEGQWDELLHHQGRFLDFKPGGPKP